MKPVLARGILAAEAPKSHTIVSTISQDGELSAVDTGWTMHHIAGVVLSPFTSENKMKLSRVGRRVLATYFAMTGVGIVGICLLVSILERAPHHIGQTTGASILSAALVIVGAFYVCRLKMALAITEEKLEQLQAAYLQMSDKMYHTREALNSASQQGQCEEGHTCTESSL